MNKLNEISSDVVMPSWLTNPIHGVMPILVVDVSVGKLITISLKGSVFG